MTLKNSFFFRDRQIIRRLHWTATRRAFFELSPMIQEGYQYPMPFRVVRSFRVFSFACARRARIRNSNFCKHYFLTFQILLRAASRHFLFCRVLVRSLSAQDSSTEVCSSKERNKFCIFCQEYMHVFHGIICVLIVASN